MQTITANDSRRLTLIPTQSVVSMMFGIGEMRRMRIPLSMIRNLNFIAE